MPVRLIQQQIFESYTLVCGCTEAGVFGAQGARSVVPGGDDTGACCCNCQQAHAARGYSPRGHHAGRVDRPAGVGAVRETPWLTVLPASCARQARKLLRVVSAHAAAPTRLLEAPIRPPPGPAAAAATPVSLPLPQPTRKLWRERDAPAPAPVGLHEARIANAPGPGASPGDGLPDIIAPATVADGSVMLRSFLQLHEPDPDAQVRQLFAALAVRLLGCCLLRAR